jgi:hypothetical protein
MSSSVKSFSRRITERLTAEASTPLASPKHLKWCTSFGIPPFSALSTFAIFNLLARLKGRFTQKLFMINHAIILSSRR